MAFSSKSYIMHSVRTTHVFQNKAAQHVYVQDTCNTDALEIRFKNKSYFYKFPLFFTRICSSRIYKSVQPGLLNTTIGKQLTVTFSTDINTPLAVEERSKPIWRPKNCMSLSSLVGCRTETNKPPSYF